MTHTGRRHPERGAPRRCRGTARGFTLVETIFALAIMTTGLLSLNTGDELLIAKEKATEGIESVFMSRDTLKITWS